MKIFANLAIIVCLASMAFASGVPLVELKPQKMLDAESAGTVIEDGVLVHVVDRGELRIGDGETSGGNPVSVPYEWVRSDGGRSWSFEKDFGLTLTRLMVYNQEDITEDAVIAIDYNPAGDGWTVAGRIQFAEAMESWDSAYGWGNHADAGYLTEYEETDPVFAESPAYGITDDLISDWSDAFGWGDHSAQGYAKSTNPVLSGYVRTEANSTNYLIRPDGGTNTISIGANGWMQLFADNTLALTVRPNGYVGICGNGSSTYKLHLSGNSYFTGSQTATSFIDIGGGAVDPSGTTTLLNLTATGEALFASIVSSSDLTVTQGVSQIILPTSGSGLTPGTLVNNSGRIETAGDVWQGRFWTNMSHNTYAVVTNTMPTDLPYDDICIVWTDNEETASSFRLPDTWIPTEQKRITIYLNSPVGGKFFYGTAAVGDLGATTDGDFIELNWVPQFGKWIIRYATRDSVYIPKELTPP